MARTDLRTLFDEVPDPRVQRTRRHPLTDVLCLVLLGTITGCRGWDAIAETFDAGLPVGDRLVALLTGLCR